MNEENQTSINVSQLIPIITAEIQESMRKKALDSFQYEIQRAVQAEISRYVQANIVPVVTKELEEARDQLKAAVVAGVQGATELVAKTFVEQTRKKMESWEGEGFARETMRALLGVKEA
jgi:hypothetical protein